MSRLDNTPPLKDSRTGPKKVQYQNQFNRATYEKASDNRQPNRPVAGLRERTTMARATSISLSEFTASVQAAVKAAVARHPKFKLEPPQAITISYLIRG